MLGKLRHIKLQLKTDRALLRCLFGVSFALLLATALNLPAPHLLAILSLMFLGKGKARLSVKKMLLILLAFFVLGSMGEFLGKYLIDFPLVIVPLLGLFTFWSFRLTQIPSPVRLIFLLFTLLLSFAGIQANFLGGFALSLLFTLFALALFIVQLSFLLFPSLPEQVSDKAKNQSSSSSLNPDKLAFNSLMVVLPIIAFFFTFNVNVLPLTFAFIILLSFDPFVYQSKKGPALIIGNIIGGLVGILAYNILVVAPSFLLYAFLIISIGGYFVVQIFSDKKTAPIFELAYKTFFVVMGTISVSENSAGSTIAERILQLGLAVVYVIVAFKVLNTFNNPEIANETN
ncbi:MAG: hypothetical protein ACK5NB_02185 [Flavobacteriaceae bacterium]